DIISDNQIKISVAIEIHPSRARAEFVRTGETCVASHIREDSLLVSEQPALSDSRDEEIIFSVVVEITDRNTHRIEFHIETGGVRDIRKRSVVIIAKQMRR